MAKTPSKVDLSQEQELDDTALGNVVGGAGISKNPFNPGDLGQALQHVGTAISQEAHQVISEVNLLVGTAIQGVATDHSHGPDKAQLQQLDEQMSKIEEAYQKHGADPSHGAANLPAGGPAGLAQEAASLTKGLVGNAVSAMENELAKTNDAKATTIEAQLGAEFQTIERQTQTVIHNATAALGNTMQIMESVMETVEQDGKAKGIP